MSASNRIQELLNSLGMEIVLAQAGTDQGQFPILDLLGNLRDFSAQATERPELHPAANAAYEQMLRIVESGQPFNPEQIAWLHTTYEQLLVLDGGSPALAPEPETATPVTSPPPSQEAPAADIAAELPLEMNLADDAELLREFVNESREHLDNIEQGVLVLEQRPTDADTLNTVFRAFHTFKGGAGFLNLIPINKLAHVLESLLDRARQGHLTINSAIIELILQGRDTLKRFVDEIEAQLSGAKPPGPCVIPTLVLQNQVRAVLDGPADASASPPGQNEVKETAPPQKETVAAPVVVPLPVPAAVTPAAPETAPAAVPGASATVKVDTHKLDNLVDMVGELVIAQSLVSQDLLQTLNCSAQFTRNMAQLGRITKELQRVSMSLRMVPIRGVFQKMARVVRDISAKINKEVFLATSGDETELDRNVVEELSDPLMHMIRNAVDHGIEPAAARVSRGKPPAGNIQLRAYHQAGNIVVEIQDDGGGLNRDKIHAKAVERGLISPEAKLTNQEIFGLIFAAGFSTADKVTEISGRGVGMDVVRRNIEKLRGRIDVDSQPGQGTTFKILLPLTLAIIDGLILQVGEERFIIPTLSVRESFRLQPGMLSTVHGRGEMVNVRGRLLPLLRLYEFFNVRPTSTDPADGIVIVLQAGADLRCVLADRLLHKQEVVIKSLGQLLASQTQALAGAAILGDGRVGLILDVNCLVHLNAQHRQAA